jgi:tRNA pseudouridine38-40 synthase
MPRYKILIEYDGTNYSGWQKQSNSNTIEEEIESALAQILRQPVDIIGQGRTDSGVHAEGQVAHFDFSEDLDRDRLLFALLGVLPHDIAVWNMEQVDEDFHARFDAISRRYRYQIALRPTPLFRSTAEMVLDELDLEAIQKCARKIRGTHNFKSFAKTDDEDPDPTCEVTRSEFSQESPLLIYHIEANRFVHHMVRRLVGTMIQVGQGKRSVEEFTDMLENPTAEKSGHGAAAKGLILEKVRYE